MNFVRAIRDTRCDEMIPIAAGTVGGTIGEEWEDGGKRFVYVAFKNFAGPVHVADLEVWWRGRDEGLREPV